MTPGFYIPPPEEGTLSCKTVKCETLKVEQRFATTAMRIVSFLIGVAWMASGILLIDNFVISCMAIATSNVWLATGIILGRLR